MMDGAWSILDDREHSYLSQFSLRFELSNLDESGQIGNMPELSFAGDFLFGGSSLCLSSRLVGWCFYFHRLFLYLHWLVLVGFDVQPSAGSSVVPGISANHSVPTGSISPRELYICYLDWLYLPSVQLRHSCFRSYRSQLFSLLPGKTHSSWFSPQVFLFLFCRLCKILCKLGDFVGSSHI